MHSFSATLRDTLLEIRDRKVFYVYWALAGLLMIAILLLPNFKIDGHEMLKGDTLPPEMIVEGTARFMSGLFGFFVFLLVFGSAGLVPAFLQKGRIELSLSKPISRYRLILLKFSAVYFLMALILTGTVTLIWLAASFRLGHVDAGYIWGLLIYLVQFLFIYSLVFCLGVLSNSGAASIMGYFIVRIGTDLLSGRKAIYAFLGDSVWRKILDGLYHILPKYGEITDNSIPLMTGKEMISSYPIYSTFVISVVLVLAALAVFHRRDY
jgi:ABC-type transport system involved in multi-copper enzyme maturation permease subunit